MSKSESECLQGFRDFTQAKNRLTAIEILETTSTPSEKFWSANMRIMQVKSSKKVAKNGGKLDITVILNGKFRQHIDVYNEGTLDEQYMESWYMALC